LIALPRKNSSAFPARQGIGATPPHHHARVAHGSAAALDDGRDGNDGVVPSEPFPYFVVETLAIGLGRGHDDFRYDLTPSKNIFTLVIYGGQNEEFFRFRNLSRALDGIRPGLYLLVGAPAIGKTSFARQLLDQVALHNHVPGIFFSFAETREELRIRTFARLSGLDQREIRRGSAYLLHWYGVPRLSAREPDELPPSWDKLKGVAAEAKDWLDRIYLFECAPNMTIDQIEAQIAELRMHSQSEQMMIVIDVASVSPASITRGYLLADHRRAAATNRPKIQPAGARSLARSRKRQRCTCAKMG
jgi:hypothetical protein